MRQFFVRLGWSLHQTRFNMKFTSLFLVTIIFTILPLPGVVADEPYQINGAKIVAFGLVAPDVTAETNAPETNLGFIHTGKSAKLLKTSDVIEAKIGTSFGIFYSLDGHPMGGGVPALIRVVHPKITNPKTEKITEVEKWDVLRHIGWTGCSFWTFDHDWEIAPGKWQFQVIYDSKVLAERTFTVRRSE